MIGFSETAVGVLLVSCWARPAGTVMMLLEVMDMVLGQLGIGGYTLV
jgi:hypothetical protein